MLNKLMAAPRASHERIPTVLTVLMLAARPSLEHTPRAMLEPMKVPREYVEYVGPRDHAELKNAPRELTEAVLMPYLTEQ